MSDKILHKLERFGMRAIALLALTTEMVDDATGLTSLRGKQGIYDFSRKLSMGEYQFKRVLRDLEEQELILKAGDKYLITPKGRAKAHKLNLQKKEQPIETKWDGKYRIAIFDIPEDERQKRNLFRSLLKRKGYIELQHSVFVYPFGDFEILNQIRHELGIEKYVNFLIAQADEVESDENLRKRFNL